MRLRPDAQNPDRVLVGSAPARTQEAAAPKPPPGTAAYEKFRFWAGLQSREAQEAADRLERYRAKLLAEGKAPAAADEQPRVIRQEVGGWRSSNGTWSC